MKKLAGLYSIITKALSKTAPTAVRVARGVVLWLMITASGISYGDNVTIKKLWKDFSAAQQKDHPQTAIGILHRIQAVAERQRRYGDLLYAMIEEHNTYRAISPDSAKAARKRILARQREWQTTNGVMAAICQTVMYEDLGVPRVDSLLASPDAQEYVKKNGTGAYKPLVEQGIDSRYLGNDLISLIAMHTNQYRGLDNYYASAPDKAAA